MASASASLDAAAAAIEKALAASSRDPVTFDRLRRVYEASDRWDDAVSALVRAAELESTPHARARMLVTAADLCHERAHNAGRAVALYEGAIADDPRVPGAFSAIEAMLVEQGDNVGLAQAYERQLQRLGEDDDDERARLLRGLAKIQHEQIADSVAAVKTLDRLVVLRPHDTQTWCDLADMLGEIDQHALAIRCLERAVRNRPFDSRLYARLHRLFEQSNEPARAFASCAVLVALGEGDASHRQVYSQGAPQVPARFARPFGDDVWEALAPEGAPLATVQLLAVLDAAAVKTWVQAARARNLIALPPAEQRIDPRATTVSGVKSFQWAAQVLGVPEPTLYAQPENASIGVATVRDEMPAVLLGRSVLTGKTPIELAFLAVRHMTYLRPGYRLLTYYPTLGDLGPLIDAAAALARTDGARLALDAPALALANALRQNLGPADIEALRAVLGEAHERHEALDLQAFARWAEIVACRAAFVASGDITVATNLLSLAGGHTAGLSARERSADLNAFSVSEQYAEVRHMLGVG